MELSWTFNTCRCCFTVATRGTPCAITVPAVLPPKPMNGKFLLSYWVVCAQRPVCQVPWMKLLTCLKPWELSLESRIDTLQFGTPFRCVFTTGPHQLQQCNRCYIDFEQLVGCFHAPKTSTTSHLSLWKLWAWPCWASCHAKCHKWSINAIFIRWAVVWVKWASVVG